MDGDQKIQAREDGGEPRNKDAHGSCDDVSVGVSGAVRGIEGPPCVYPTADDGIDRENRSQIIEVPTEEV